MEQPTLPPKQPANGSEVGEPPAARDQPNANLAEGSLEGGSQQGRSRGRSRSRGRQGHRKWSHSASRTRVSQERTRNRSGRRRSRSRSRRRRSRSRSRSKSRHRRSRSTDRSRSREAQHRDKRRHGSPRSHRHGKEEKGKAEEDRHRQRRSRSRSRSSQRKQRGSKPAAAASDQPAQPASLATRPAGDRAAAPAAPARSPRAAGKKLRLSFEDEMEEEGGDALAAAQPAGICPAPVSSLGQATTSRFAKERTLVLLKPSAAMGAVPANAQTVLDDDELPPASGGVASLGQIAFGSYQAKGMRPYMEDRHTIVPSFTLSGAGGRPVQDGVARCFAGVYDGHNGAGAAEHAADRIHTLLAEEPLLRACMGDGSPAAVAGEAESVASALVRAFEVADREILQRCKLEGTRGGATAVVTLRIGSSLYAAHAGDSRAVLCRRGDAVRLTEDHKPDLPRERQRVEELGGRVDFARCWRVIVEPGGGRPASGLAVSRSLGDPDFKDPKKLVTPTPDVMHERLRPGDSFVVLATDGLWDVMSDGDACEIVTDHLSRLFGPAPAGAGQLPVAALNSAAAASAAQALVGEALSRGTMDNVTAVVGLMRWG